MLLLLLALQATQAQAAQQPATVEVKPAAASVTAGATLQLSVTARDSAGKEVRGAPVVWTATPFDIATVDTTGKLTAFRQGRAQVFAIVGGKPGIATIEIEPKPPSSVELSAGSSELVPGATTLITATPRTDDAVPLSNVAVTYRSSDERVATVAPGGTVTARAVGTATITAQAGPARGELRLRVGANPVTRLTVSGPARASTGDVVRLSAKGTGAGNREVANPPVRWSVSGVGASVYSDGAFVAERPGTYLVTASVGSVVATHPIAVSQRVHARRFEMVTHRGFGDVQAAEAWAIGNALYVSTIANRVYTFDISTPGNPVKVDSIVVDAQVINDISTTADGKIGVLTREGASSRKNGLVFLDLADPLHPKVLSEFTETVTGGVHSAYVDGHYVYATDDATGSLRVIDFSNPRQPKQVARWEVKEELAVTTNVMGQQFTAGRMLHDVQVQDGIAYLAYWKHGLIILDVGKGINGGSPENPQLVSRLMYNVADYYPPDMLAGTHAVFRYKNYVFLGDEVFPGIFDLSSRERIKSLGRVHIVDVSDIERPVKVAEYNVQDKGSHNMWVLDDVMYIGYYEGGLRAVDVSGELRGDLMAQGREIGAVWTGSSEGFRPNLPMTWGAQPHNGFVYASDINSGLWVARLTPAPVP
ncbi:MAG TPA: Ig-like domain-containing protein [Gemmatimonadaceae bacterium]|nr:Ig-like domain-containing protein [Gemmatimonadaceae bacterium]